jgi:hypothetical protein
MKFSNRQISPPTVPQRTVHPNHPIIIRFPGQNHPISASPHLIARTDSTDNRLVFRRQSSDAASKIVRDRRVKRPSRQSPLICSAANPVEFLGIWETDHNPDFNSGEFATVKSQAGLNSYRPIAEIVEKQVVIEAEARETDKALRKILKELGGNRR